MVRFEIPRPETVVQVAVLGPLTLTRDGSRLDLTGPKRRALLILLALHAGTPLSRDRMVEALWPSTRTGREEATLRVHISHLRDVLEPSRNGEPQVVVTRGSAYMLSSDAVSIDLDRFDELSREGRSLLSAQPDVALDLLNEALGLWRGRPLQDVEYEEFAQDKIRRLESSRLEAVENRALALMELGDDTAAIEDLEPLMRMDPARELPTRLLMRALYRTGRHAESLRVARRHARALAEQGLGISPRVSRLEERILQHDPALLPEGTVSMTDIRPGRSIRGYELRAMAGSGSIGVVYRAYQAAVGREVALKMVNERLAQAPEFVRRFTEEARMVAHLEHPHIVPLYDFWRDPVGAFLVMRWMEGGSLQQRIGRPWTPRDVERVFGQLAEALGYAHSAGVVHRDVKPSNVLFDAADNAYLCDFGLAVTSLGTGAQGEGRLSVLRPPYGSPELIRGERPSVASDVYGLGVMLAEAVSGEEFKGADTPIAGDLREVVLVATSSNPAERYPDMDAFRSALVEALQPTTAHVPRRVRRNPFKGLTPFQESDRADFYGRDDVVETLVGMVASNGMTTIIGASGSGKSSVVLAGLIPELRAGTLPGSDEWSIVSMVPATDPFDEFHLALRGAAVASPGTRPRDGSRELREAFFAALDGPTGRALLVVDQFEELFSAEIDDDTRRLFLDNLVDLAQEPASPAKVILTLRADFADRPLSHPVFGALLARGSVLLPPMRPDQVEDVIRRPAARVGIQVEPGLVAQMVLDVSSAPACLPLLQYVLAELFERRIEDKLTMHAYRGLGGVEAVLERQAEATFAALNQGARQACRQLFLRLVSLGEHGEETRRRLPLNELQGLGGAPADTDDALAAFSEVRLVTFDRDPATRTPTVEVAHETVLRNWARYRIWIDETRGDLLAHRRLGAAASTWVDSDEDPLYLLSGGPLATALEVASAGRVELNEVEARFVSESQQAEVAVRQAEEERRRQEVILERRSRRRLQIGMSVTAVAVVIAVLAIMAVLARQRANSQALAQELASASVANLGSADPDLSLLLAIEAADMNLGADDHVSPQVVDALHRALINPRSEILAEGAGKDLGGNVLDYSSDGESIAVLAEDGGAFVLSSTDGRVLGRVPTMDPPAFGVAFHPKDKDTILTIHPDAVRVWNWLEKRMTLELPGPATASVTTAVYSHNGSQIAVGADDGVVRVFTNSGRIVAPLPGHAGEVNSIAFDNSDERLVSAGADLKVMVWNISKRKAHIISLPFGVNGRLHVAWNPVASSRFAPDGAFAVTTEYGEMWLYQASGERVNSFGNGNNPSHALDFSPDGSFIVAAGADGAARLYGSWTGGEAFITLPTQGAPLRDAEFNPAKPLDVEVTTVGVDGTVRIWRNLLRSELPARNFGYIAPHLTSTPDGRRYAVAGHNLWYGLKSKTLMVEVFDSVDDKLLASRPSLDSYADPRPAISPDGTLLAYTGVDGDIHILAVNTGSELALTGSKGNDQAKAFSSDGTILAGTGGDGRISLWDTGSGELIRRIAGHGDRRPDNISQPAQVGYIPQMAFRPHGTELASVGYDGTVRLSDPAIGQSRILRTFDYELFALAYSADGSTLAVAERTGDIHVLDSDTGETVLDPDPVSGPPTALAFSPDAGSLAGAGPGHFAYLWDMGSGRLVRRIQGSVYAPMGVAFVDGEMQLLVLATEGILRRYLLDPADMVQLARTEVRRGLTEAECQRYLGRSCDD